MQGITSRQRFLGSGGFRGGKVLGPPSQVESLTLELCDFEQLIRSCS